MGDIKVDIGKIEVNYEDVPDDLMNFLKVFKYKGVGKCYQKSK